MQIYKYCSLKYFVNTFVLMGCTSSWLRSYFFLARVARGFTGDGDFLGEAAGAALFLAPLFGAGDFLTGVAFAFLGSGACGSSSAGAATAAFFPPFLGAFLGGVTGFSGLSDFWTPLDLFSGDSSVTPETGERFRLAGDEVDSAAAAVVVSAVEAAAALPRPRAAGFWTALPLLAAPLPLPFLTGLGDFLAGEASVGAGTTGTSG